MAATSLIVYVADIGYNTSISKYFVTWFSKDDEDQTDSGITTFTISELTTVVNARVLSDAKASHNSVYGTSFGPLTPAKLVSGLI